MTDDIFERMMSEATLAKATKLSTIAVHSEMKEECLVGASYEVGAFRFVATMTSEGEYAVQEKPVMLSLGSPDRFVFLDKAVYSSLAEVDEEVKTKVLAGFKGRLHKPPKQTTRRKPKTAKK